MPDTSEGHSAILGAVPAIAGKIAETIAAKVRPLLNGKVDKVTGKGLSTNDYTAPEKSKLSGIEEQANRTVIDDTLSVAGNAADAKATGDAVTALQSENAILKELLQGVDAPIYLTASGNPATFSDGYPANLRELAVTLTPSQSGSGTPYPPGGKNLFWVGSAPTDSFGTSHPDFSILYSGDGYLLNGTAPSNALFFRKTVTLPAGDYALSLDSPPPSNGRYWTRIRNAANIIAQLPLAGSTPSAFSLSEQTEIKMEITIVANRAFQNEKLKIQLEAAAAPTAYEPPANIRPISGVSSVSVARTGKNLMKLDATKFAGSPEFFSLQADGTVIFNGTVTGNTFLDLRGASYPLYLPAGDYVISAVEDIPVSGCNIYGLKDGQYYWSSSGNSTKPGVSIHSEGGYWQIKLMATAGTYENIRFKPMVRLASAPAGYELCDERIVAIPLVDSNSDPLTVYGGTLNVTTGTLSVTHGEYNPYNGETLPGRWISDRDAYAEGASPTIGAQVVYELAAPVAYSLAPAQIAALPGCNAVSVDAETLSLEYRADPSLSMGG